MGGFRKKFIYISYQTIYYSFTQLGFSVISEQMRGLEYDLIIQICYVALSSQVVRWVTWIVGADI